MALSAHSRLADDLTDQEHDNIVQCFTGTFGDTVALTNGTGFPSSDNHITGEMVGRVAKWAKAIRCGTDSITGSIETNVRGWEMIKADAFYYWDGPPMSYGVEILQDPRVGIATNIYPGGVVNHFPNRGGIPEGTPIPYPFVTMQDVYYPLWYLQKYTGERRAIGYRP